MSEIVWLRAGLPKRMLVKNTYGTRRTTGARLERGALSKATRDSLVKAGVLDAPAAASRQAAHEQLEGMSLDSHVLAIMAVSFLFKDSPEQYLLDHQKEWKQFY
eukprot:7554916-Lingulodinium_polyedra.AAC.1